MKNTKICGSFCSMVILGFIFYKVISFNLSFNAKNYFKVHRKLTDALSTHLIIYLINM